MKRFMISLLFFTLVFVLADAILLLIWNPSSKMTYGHLNTRLREAEKFNNVDILFLGSSRAYRGFDIRNFQEHGLYTFNLGSSNQTPIQTKILIDKYLQGLNPHLVIYEVSPDIFSNDGVESALDVLVNDRINIETVITFAKIGNTQVYRYLFYALLRDLLRLNINYHLPICLGDDTYISGGYVQKNMAYFIKRNDVQETAYIPNKSQLTAFNEIISYFKMKKINYILITAPCTRIRYNSYINIHEFQDMMRQQGTYYDFNELLNLDDSLYFYDANHLNQKGVDVFNTKIIEMFFAGSK